MLFLEKIDEHHNLCRESMSIPTENRDFCSFIPISISDKSKSKSFLIMKSNRAKLLLIDGKQKIYLSDWDIMRTILDMEEADIEWFLRQFSRLYQGEGTDIQLDIFGEQYSGKGIETYPYDKKLYLFSDTMTDFHSFCFILDFVFLKDKCWEILSKTDGFGQKTLCKYISLIDFHHYPAKRRSAAFLQQIGYNGKEQYPSNTRRTRNLFADMENIKTFDISPYLC